MKYDCIVVGAGPGGSLAAYDLASAGASVLLVDRASFPRDKPCGGGVLLSAMAHVPFSLEPVIERTLYRFRLRYRGDWEFAHRHDAPLVHMTQRTRLDAYLAEQASGAGAVFQDGRRVLEVVPEALGVCVRFAGGEVARATALVAADGVNGICRQSLGLPVMRSAVALEANTPDVPAGWGDALGLELGRMPGGYGWVFPKGDHCNVGVGGWLSMGPTLRTELDRYGTAERFQPSELSGHRGYRLPYREAGSPLVVGRVALVGDAAGLVDPLSGEGIGNAFRSGRMAAAAVSAVLAGEASDLEPYAAEVERTMGEELAVAQQLSDLLHDHPWAYAQIMRRWGWFRGALCRIVRGESGYPALRRRLGPLAPAFDYAARRAAGRARGRGAPAGAS
ncbi:MAG: Pyruvate/2-oxoglutarate dehydrogenase complex [Chloroflexi bacterium]|nr:MAG: Pyruvate/2-oxoglutarate dehydrogenase complex [Chloroflexota bacterium]